MVRLLFATLRAFCAPSAAALVFATLAPAQDCVFPPTPEPVRVVQANGATLQLRLKGTGLNNWYEDLDGHPVVRVGDVYEYARLGADGRLHSAGLRVGRADPQEFGIATGVRPVALSSTGPVPGLPGQNGIGASGAGSTLALDSGIGTVKNLVVLLRFNGHGPGGQNRNLPSTANVNTIMNAVGGDPVLAPTGSVRDAYIENSYGQLFIDSTATVWVDVPGSESYYANGNSGLTSRTWELIIDGLNIADNTIDFSQFDQDGDGVVDAITFLHSGYGAEWGGTDQYGAFYTNRMWSHKWQIPGWTSNEGVEVGTYNISPGLWGTSGSGPGRIGVVCHELGHFFGLPDTYDTDGSSNGSGNWCLMAAGSWGFDGSQRYPSHMSAWSKVKMGWLQPQVILPGTYGVPQVENNPTIFKIDSGYPPGEYLLVENRNAWGFDARIPVSGLAVWHVDETKGSFGFNNPNTDEGYPGQGGWPGNGRHYRAALLQADNNYNLERNNNRGDGGDLYHASGVNSITGNSSPNTDAYQDGNGIDNGIAITGIGSSGSNVSMTYTSAQSPSVTTNSLPDAILGLAYSETLGAAGGNGPLVWTEHLPAADYTVTDLGASLYSATGVGQNWQSDEGIWALNLPFLFPFYEGHYDVVYVSSNGFVSFSPIEPEPYNSPYTLRASRRIAPLWDNLTTSGGSRDVYVDTGVAGEVTIRWNARTASGGNSVRMAVVLFEDGRVRFDYGSGNNNLSPTVGISKGEGRFFENPPSHDGASNLASANSLMFTLTGSDMPPGLSLDTDGTLSGSPSLAGSYSPWFRVTDAEYRYDYRQLSFQVGSGADCNGNGIPDSTDIANGTSLDCNGNNVPDECELVGNDCNANGIPDECEALADCNSNGTPDVCEAIADCNSNGIPDECELGANDCNTNGIPDDCELAADDCNSNGTLDVCEGLVDCNSNGTPDECETLIDCNSNGVPDECELAGNDCNTNGIPDDCELASDDCNANGTLDQCEGLADCNSNGTPDECETIIDCNTNGIPDECELAGNDCNTNGIPDDCELAADDCNSNGTLDQCEGLTDCNSNGTPDECETFTDCNSNGIPDECELAGNDCDTNGIPDDCELAANDCNLNGTLDQCEGLVDCNSNGTPDECETFTDCNGNAIPDECELDGNDCNTNGIPDECELAANDCNSNGILDQCEGLADCNSNGTPDECEAFTDCNSNGTPDECELVGNDCNTNGIPDDCELASDDCNANGVLDQCEGLADCNANGTPDECETFTDCNSNGIPDECELVANDCNTNGIPDDCELASDDCNANGILDQCEGLADCNNNGTPDQCETITDCNANGIPDECELVANDCNKNGIPDECELAGDDCNANGILDQCEGLTDCNNNGTPDECESFADCNSNGIPDECELVSNDCNTNGIPDDCELGGDDCNSNGILDQCEGLTDCNGNGTPDECETVTDCNSNGVPDECELAANDCNTNGIPDDCELVADDCNSNGVLDQCEGLADCNANGTPDECETITDCNSNGVPDECELAGNDCNTNGIPDECELATDDCNSNGVLDQCEGLADCNNNGTPDECETITDCNSNGIPDECELNANDCNTNGIPDDCELAGGDCNANGTLDSCESFADCNSNGIPDECDIASGTSLDTDLNGIPDECGPGTAYCFGDGSGTACPCGNPGAPGTGCGNSSGVGASLSATGSASALLDDLTFSASGLLPGQSALLFSGLTQVNGGAGSPFGDGLLCVGGQISRLTVQVPSAAGTATWGSGLGSTYGWASGQTRTFQVWYRDNTGSPCGSQFNVSNGFAVTFTP